MSVDRSSAPAVSAHDQLPRSSGVPHPRTAALTRLRPPARRLLRRWYDVRVHRPELAPTTGPVIFAANHLGWWDGPMLAIFAPRPVHALTKIEMFSGPMAPFLRWSGQIPLDRLHPDPGAVKSCLRVLRDGGAVGVFPEGHRGAGDLAYSRRGAAYLALVTGVPVVPVTIFGTRLPGEGSRSRPPRGSRIDLVVGSSWRVDPTPWPRRSAEVAARTEELRLHLRQALADAEELTGRTLPGPLPAGDTERLIAERQDAS